MKQSRIEKKGNRKRKGKGKRKNVIKGNEPASRLFASSASLRFNHIEKEREWKEVIPFALFYFKGYSGINCNEFEARRS